jgi:hypothetical protein
VRQNYEYRIVTGYGDVLERILSELGRESWKLHTVIAVTPQYHVCYVERPVQ